MFLPNPIKQPKECVVQSFVKLQYSLFSSLIFLYPALNKNCMSSHDQYIFWILFTVQLNPLHVYTMKLSMAAFSRSESIRSMRPALNSYQSIPSDP